MWHAARLRWPDPLGAFLALGLAWSGVMVLRTSVMGKDAGATLALLGRAADTPFVAFALLLLAALLLVRPRRWHFALCAAWWGLLAASAWYVGEGPSIGGGLYALCCLASVVEAFSRRRAEHP